MDSNVDFHNLCSSLPLQDLLAILYLTKWNKTRSIQHERETGENTEEGSEDPYEKYFRLYFRRHLSLWTVKWIIKWFIFGS